MKFDLSKGIFNNLAHMAEFAIKLYEAGQISRRSVVHFVNEMFRGACVDHEDTRGIFKKVRFMGFNFKIGRRGKERW